MPGDAPLQSRAFRLPKRGHTAQEYEDACAAADRRGRFAVADGASESAFAGQWARLLANGFVQAADPPGDWAGWLPSQRQRWQAEVGGGELPWYAEEKVRQGAFATFLGLVVEGAGWRAVAVGDSCLFHVRAGRLTKAFPVEHSGDFGNSPWLIGSHHSPGEALAKGVVVCEGRWRAGDRLWLMTDALAQWFLQQHEAGNRPWETLDAVLTAAAPDEAFAAWAEGLRQTQALRNDDVTWVAVSL
jgi:hypothetical protein